MIVVVDQRFTNSLQGYRTGYLYKHPLVKEDLPKPKCDVEVPPAVSSLGYLLEEEQLYKDGYGLFYGRIPLLL